MTSGPRRFRSGYRNPATNEWVLGAPDAPDAIVGYYDPDADQWAEGVADIESGEWIPVDAVRGTGGRDCPPGFPVKGNLPSRVFHSPGQPNYDRTTPEVCFANDAAARDAGFRHARAGDRPHPPLRPRLPRPLPRLLLRPRPRLLLSLPRRRGRMPARSTPPPPPRPTAPPPPREPGRNWLWWILGALAIAALLWWFFFRPQQQPAAPVAPTATVAAPAARTKATRHPSDASEGEPGLGTGHPRARVASPVAGSHRSQGNDPGWRRRWPMRLRPRRPSSRRQRLRSGLSPRRAPQAIALSVACRTV